MASSAEYPLIRSIERFQEVTRPILSRVKTPSAIVSIICSIKWMFQISWVFEYTACPAWFQFEGHLALPDVTFDSTRGALACQPGKQYCGLHKTLLDLEECDMRLLTVIHRIDRLKPESLWNTGNRPSMTPVDN